MNKEKKKQNIFLKGFAVVLPTLIIIFIMSFAIGFLYKYMAGPLGKGVLNLLDWLPSLDLASAKQNRYIISAIGFPLAIVIVFFIGTFFGRLLMKALEQMILYRFPIIRSIYPYAKQFAELVLPDGTTPGQMEKFQKVVAVEYPRPGIYQLGFITSEGLKDLNDALGKKTVTVFLPTSPTPFTGWTAFISAEQLIHLSLTVEEAIRIIVSGGVLIPERQLTEWREDKEK